MIPQSAVNSEAAFSLHTTTPVNLKKRSEYTLTLTNPRLTTSIILGQLESCIVDDAVLEVPDTSKFGVSFLAKANIGDIVSFGNYRVTNEGQVTIYYDGTEGTDILGEIHLVDDKVRRYSISFDGESVAIRIDDQDHEFPAPVDEFITHLDLLDAGGILESVFYWSRPITKFEHQSLMESTVSLPDPYPLVKMVTDEMFMYPVTRTLYHDTNPALDTNAIGWVPVFSSDSRFTTNYAPTESGEFIYVFPEETGVEGEVTITEFLDGQINMDSYVEINVGGVGPGELAHPVWRSSITGSRGGAVITPIEEAEPLAAVSFWMDPFEGEIMPDVTMTGGVVSGATYINGQEYSSTPIEDRFMVTVNNPPTEFTINPNITNFMTSVTTLSPAQARGLYESFFILPAIKTLPDTVPVSEGSVFTIDDTWGIVTSG